MPNVKNKTVAQRVREVAARLGEFAPVDLADAIDPSTRRERQAIMGAVPDFVRRGEMARIAPGRYRYLGRERRRTKMDIVWHLVRSHRSFTADEIERLSGAARATVLEYLKCLKALGFLRKPARGRWLLVNDPGPETPVNVAKCERLRKLRRNR